MSEAKELRQLSLIIEQLKRDHRAEYDYYHPLLTAADELAAACLQWFGCEDDIRTDWGKIEHNVLEKLAAYHEARGKGKKE